MAIKVKPYKIQAHGRSDAGLVRENNEDFWYVEPRSNIFVLCDGMGGHSAGEVASQEAVSTFSGLIREHFGESPDQLKACSADLYRELIQQVNAAVYSLSRKDRDLRGMGTTFCSVYFQSDKMLVGHVGDSRVYLLRDQKLAQLTEDHSLVSELLQLGELNSRQAREYTYRNVITRAIGTEPEVDPSVQSCTLKAGDRILMCSDGLSDMLQDHEIEKVLNQGRPLEETVDSLIERANRKGGHDNITAVLIRLEEAR